MADEHPGGVEPTADYYRRLVERISDVVSVVDEEGIVRYQSPSSERVKGWPAAALVGENMLAYVHPADRDRVADLMRSIVDDPGARTDRVEYRFRTPDDDYVWLASTGSNPADGVIDGYVVTSRDVTERRRLEAALRRERDRLEAFATVVSHDLLGPLNVVDGSIDLAEESGDPEHFERARGGVDRIEELTDDLLTLAKEGAVIGDREPVRLAAVAERAWEGLHTADATLTAESTATVRADEARLRQLFENLFRNALEHVGGDVAVVVDDTPDGDGFLVADDGPGVPEADRERVFEVGVSTASRETGMGLAIVRKVAEAHGWSVAATGSDRGGARFEVTGVDPVDDG